jgi:hypothetical protein
MGHAGQKREGWPALRFFEGGSCNLGSQGTQRRSALFFKIVQIASRLTHVVSRETSLAQPQYVFSVSRGTHSYTPLAFVRGVGFT